MLSSNFRLEQHHRYTDNCEGPGRWYYAYLDTEEMIGYVWTNDREGFGMILTTYSYAAQRALDWFVFSRNRWSESKTTATEAFDSFYQQQAAWSPVSPISAGDLVTELQQTVREEMEIGGVYIEYGVTVSDDGDVLELLRHDPSGSFFREGSGWVEINRDADEDEYPTIYGQQWVEVDESFIDYYDQNSSSGEFNLSDIELYVI